MQQSTQEATKKNQNLQTQTLLGVVTARARKKRTQAPDSTYQREQGQIVGLDELYYDEDTGGGILVVPGQPGK
jgi:hypothetical protein